MTINKQNSKKLVLYTLIGCHLCDQVAVMLRDMEVACTPVEIDTDPELERKYDIHIPVLYLPDADKELFFPFSKDQIQEFLEGEI